MEKAPGTENLDTKKKTFLYHLVPEYMKGDVLHPLNSLQDIHPEIYAKEVSKYEGRKEVMELFIPTLEAAWNEVIHLTAINPAELKQALVEAGMTPREMKFYQVDPDLLDPAKTTIYIYQDSNNMDPENFTKFDPQDLEVHSTVQPRTKGHYKEVVASTKEFYKQALRMGKMPFMFVGIPHILHKGSIDISQFPTIVV